MAKKVIAALGALILLVVVALVLAVAKLDAIVTKVIETEGSRVVGTPITVGEVETSLREGRATIRDLRIANPAGFSDQPMFRVDELSAQVDFKSGAVRDVQIKGPYLYVEQRGASNNFRVVQQHVAAMSGDEQAPAEETPPDTGDNVHLQVDSFVMTDAQVAYHLVDAGKTGQVTVAEIAFSDLNGTPAAVTRQVVRQLAQQVVDGLVAEAVDIGRSAIREEIDSQVDKARENLSESIQEAGKELTGKIGESLSGLNPLLKKPGGADAEK